MIDLELPPGASPQNRHRRGPTTTAAQQHQRGNNNHHHHRSSSSLAAAAVVSSCRESTRSSRCMNTVVAAPVVATYSNTLPAVVRKGGHASMSALPSPDSLINNHFSDIVLPVGIQQARSVVKPPQFSEVDEEPTEVGAGENDVITESPCKSSCSIPVDPILECRAPPPPPSPALPTTLTSSSSLSSAASVHSLTSPGPRTDTPTRMVPRRTPSSRQRRTGISTDAASVGSATTSSASVSSARNNNNSNNNNNSSNSNNNNSSSGSRGVVLSAGGSHHKQQQAHAMRAVAAAAASAAANDDVSVVSLSNIHNKKKKRPTGVMVGMGAMCPNSVTASLQNQKMKSKLATSRESHHGGVPSAHSHHLHQHHHQQQQPQQLQHHLQHATHDDDDNDNAFGAADSVHGNKVKKSASGGGGGKNNRRMSTCEGSAFGAADSLHSAANRRASTGTAPALTGSSNHGARQRDIFNSSTAAIVALDPVRPTGARGAAAEQPKQRSTKTAHHRIAQDLLGSGSIHSTTSKSHKLLHPLSRPSPSSSHTQMRAERKILFDPLGHDDSESTSNSNESDQDELAYVDRMFAQTRAGCPGLSGSVNNNNSSRHSRQESCGGASSGSSHNNNSTISNNSNHNRRAQQRRGSAASAAALGGHLTMQQGRRGSNGGYSISAATHAVDGSISNSSHMRRRASAGTGMIMSTSTKGGILDDIMSVDGGISRQSEKMRKSRRKSALGTSSVTVTTPTTTNATESLTSSAASSTMGKVKRRGSGGSKPQRRSSGVKAGAGHQRQLQAAALAAVSSLPPNSTGASPNCSTPVTSPEKSSTLPRVHRQDGGGNGNGQTTLTAQLQGNSANRRRGSASGASVSGMSRVSSANRSVSGSVARRAMSMHMAGTPSSSHPTIPITEPIRQKKMSCELPSPKVDVPKRPMSGTAWPSPWDDSPWEDDAGFNPQPPSRRQEIEQQQPVIRARRMSSGSFDVAPSLREQDGQRRMSATFHAQGSRPVDGLGRRMSNEGGRRMSNEGGRRMSNEGGRRMSNEGGRRMSNGTAAAAGASKLDTRATTKEGRQRQAGRSRSMQLNCSRPRRDSAHGSSNSGAERSQTMCHVPSPKGKRRGSVSAKENTAMRRRLHNADLGGAPLVCSSDEDDGDIISIKPKHPSIATVPENEATPARIRRTPVRRISRTFDGTGKSSTSGEGDEISVQKQLNHSNYSDDCKSMAESTSTPSTDICSSLSPPSQRRHQSTRDGGAAGTSDDGNSGSLSGLRHLQNSRRSMATGGMDIDNKSVMSSLSRAQRRFTSPANAFSPTKLQQFQW